MHNIDTGLIGTGKWGKILQNKISEVSNLKFSINSKKNYKKFINKADFIFIATPNETHFKIVEYCLNKKKHVFCEKPLATTYKNSKKLFNIARNKKLILYVDDVQSFHPKKIRLNKKNFIIRKKSGNDKISNLLYRFAYHDFYFFYKKLIKMKNIKIKIIDKIKNLSFRIYDDEIEFNFSYSLNCKKKIYKINNISMETKQDILKKMILNVLKRKKISRDNKIKSLFANKLIDKVLKKL